MFFISFLFFYLLEANLGLVPLQICNHTFKAVYDGNYQNSALFFTADRVSRNEPQLLYYTTTYFILETAGFDTGLSVDLGQCSLTDLNYYSIIRPADSQKIRTESAGLVVGNCYGVWTLHQETQGIWAFKVNSVVPGGGPVSISWTVFFFQIDGNYVIGNYDSHPTYNCTNPDLPSSGKGKLPVKHHH